MSCMSVRWWNSGLKIRHLKGALSSLDLAVQNPASQSAVKCERSLNLICILISHDLEIVRYLPDLILVMYSGSKIVFSRVTSKSGNP